MPYAIGMMGMQCIQPRHSQHSRRKGTVHFIAWLLQHTRPPQPYRGQALGSVVCLRLHIACMRGGGGERVYSAYLKRI